MTVQELIEELQDLDPAAKVSVCIQDVSVCIQDVSVCIQYADVTGWESGYIGKNGGLYPEDELPTEEGPYVSAVVLQT